jgi:hypothetical protein
MPISDVAASLTQHLFVHITGRRLPTHEKTWNSIDNATAPTGSMGFRFPHFSLVALHAQATML